MASPRRVGLTPPALGSLARDPVRPRPPIISVSLENLRVINNTCWHGKAGKQEASPSPPAEGAAQLPEMLCRRETGAPPAQSIPTSPSNHPSPNTGGTYHPIPQSKEGPAVRPKVCRPRAVLTLPRHILPAPTSAVHRRCRSLGSRPRGLRLGGNSIQMELFFHIFMGEGKGRFGKSRWDRESIGKERVGNGGSTALCFCGMLPALVGKPGMG